MADERSNPLEGVQVPGAATTPDEQIALFQQTMQHALKPTPRVRQSPRWDSEVRRKERQLAVTFSSSDLPKRIKALAMRWEVLVDGRPGYSKVVEYLLRSQVDLAEQGKIAPPR